MRRINMFCVGMELVVLDTVDRLHVQGGEECTNELGGGLHQVQRGGCRCDGNELGAGERQRL